MNTGILGVSPRAGASRSGRWMAAALAVVVTLLLIAAQPSLAAETRTYTGESIGGAQPFQRVGAVGINPDTGVVYVADTGKGSLFAYTETGQPSNFSALSSNEISGLHFLSEADEVQIAVDHGTGDFYAVVQGEGAGAIEKFNSAGEPADFSSLGSPEINAPGGGEICGVAVDSIGDLYVSNYYNAIEVLSPTGEPITTVPAVHVCQVAVGEGGLVYANLFQGPVERFEPSEYPPTAATAFTASGPLTSGMDRSVYSDPTGGPLFVDEGSAVAEYDLTGNPLSTFAAIGEGRVSDSESAVYGQSAAKAFVADGDTDVVNIFGPREPQRPTISSQSVVSVGLGEAKLSATINPAGSKTSAFVEYGRSPCSVGPCSRTAAVPLGEGEAAVDATFEIEGLELGTTYYFRVIASSPAGPSTGPDRSFTTTTPAAPGSEACANESTRTPPARWLLDCRAYEMVSPIDKDGNDIRALPDVTGNPTAIDQSSPDGEALTFSTFGAFADPEGNPYVSQYLSTRSGTGWSTRNLTPPREHEDEELKNEFKAFSADLSRSWVVHAGGPSLAAGGPAEGPTLYERSTASNGYLAINTTDDSEFILESHSAIELMGVVGHRTFFRVPVGTASEYHVFEYKAGNLKEISLLPDESSFPGSAIIGSFGSSVFDAGPLVWLDHAISADGSRIYWSGSTAFSEGAALFVRVNGTETRPVSELAGSGNARFRLASSDGSRALFSLKEFGQPPALYEYSLASNSVRKVSGETLGVVGGSEDMSTFYFVSSEDLAEEAEAGQPNLYMDREGQIGLVAVLSPLDTTEAGLSRHQAEAASGFPIMHSSAVSADGGVVVFESRGSLTGYDNRGIRSGEPENEVYRFDSSGDELDCLSCDPSGARPDGRETVIGEGVLEGVWSAAQVPPWQTALHEPNVLVNGGGRVFFNSYSPVLPRDVNGQEDVYEWEAPGVGTCTNGSADYLRQNDGCLDLVSTGKDSLGSEFLDASPSGHDAFFSTAESLVSTDPGSIDIYDAREAGGFPEPAAAPSICEGQACQESSPLKDTTSAAGTATFAGPGNKPHKRRHKKHHRKKAKHHHQNRHKGGKKSGRGGTRASRPASGRTGK